VNLPRRQWLASSMAWATSPLWAQQAAPEPADAALQAALAKVLTGDWRSPANRARDAARHPAQTLAFFGLHPDAIVVEAAPGGGWYTEVLAPLLRTTGQLWAAHEAADDTEPARRRARQAFDAKLASRPDVYDRVRVGALARSPQFGPDIAPAGGADFVLTFRNLHNWLQAGHLDATLKAFHGVLKPGGVLGVEEHRAPPGASLDWVVKNGYVPEALAIERARAAGFELVARSEVNANPRDDKNHPHGVWSLPPTQAGGEERRAEFLAIGESDRFTHRYRRVG
jgi:predicted methyltransferase